MISMSRLRPTPWAADEGGYSYGRRWDENFGPDKGAHGGYQDQWYTCNSIRGPCLPGQARCVRGRDESSGGDVGRKGVKQ